MRMWANVGLQRLAGWLDPRAAELPADDIVERSTAFTAPVVHADLLFTAGPARLMHVEYETRPRADLARRMFEYRARIMMHHPDAQFTQYVIVLGDGVVKGHDDLERFGFMLDLRVIYLRERDPEEFLSSPELAPLAVLARGSRAVRERSLAAAFRLLKNSSHPRVIDLRLSAELLAGIRLDRPTIDRIARECDMDISDIRPMVEYYRHTNWAQELLRESEAEVRQQGLELGLERGQQQGLERGQQQGREQGREQMLIALLRTRFGDDAHVQEAAHHLASWDEGAAIAAITEAADPQSLLTARSPA
jgi:predicted transposase/invertase (TIGR01784 family)